MYIIYRLSLHTHTQTRKRILEVINDRNEQRTKELIKKLIRLQIVNVRASYFIHIYITYTERNMEYSDIYERGNKREDTIHT